MADITLCTGQLDDEACELRIWCHRWMTPPSGMQSMMEMPVERPCLLFWEEE